MNNNFYIRTDLACENGILSPDKFKDYERETVGEYTVERVIKGDEKYVTVSSHKIRDYFLKDSDVCDILYREICALGKEMTGRSFDCETRVLAVGLGNRFITSDSLGVLCADKINATGHAGHILEGIDCCKVSVIQPGVMGQTGLEASLLIKEAARDIRPHIIIAIDSLAARSTDRLMSVIQLSSGGIAPGSGIGNRRGAVCAEETGCPAMAIGVPTVVDSSTMTWDTLKMGNVTVTEEIERILENGRSFFVSPKDCDMGIGYLSEVISRAVNKALGTEDF